jgi:paraquat-inducible protein A
MPDTTLPCPECGLEHQPVSLSHGETAHCVQCHSLLEKKGWFGSDASLAFTLTGLLLILPSTLLPFVTVSKLGNERVSFLFTGVQALWADGMHLLAVWVLLCGGMAPIFLLLSLAFLLLPPRLGWKPMQTQRLLKTARAVAYWAIPEVQVLAVLVALAKLGHAVHVQLGPGFWCYAALAIMTLLAWRGFELDSSRLEPRLIRVTR